MLPELLLLLLLERLLIVVWLLCRQINLAWVYEQCVNCRCVLIESSLSEAVAIVGVVEGLAKQGETRMGF